MSPSKAALSLARRLAALPEPPMREKVLLEHVRRQKDLDRLVRVLDEVYHLGREGGPPFNVALLTIASALSQGLLEYEELKALYAAAKAADLAAVSELLLTGQSRRRISRRQDKQDQTLGHRKWLARSNERDVLDKLLRNPEPEVVHNLLRNPKITEDDVVRLASRRPADVAVQQEIFGSRKWLARYGVKRALVLNPYTPTDLGLRLLGFLGAPDLRLVCSSPTLPGALRRAAARLIEHASPPRSG